MNFLLLGFEMQICVLIRPIQTRTTSASVRRSLFLCGGEKGGFGKKIRAVGSNGIADTTWAAGATMTNGR